MRYNINAEIGLLVKALYDAGYAGEVTMSRSGATGTVEALCGEDFIAAELSGFCKETLYIMLDSTTGEYVMVGRYRMIDRDPTLFSVEYIVKEAWRMYKSYKQKGYERPADWEQCFFKFGYLTSKKVEQTIVEEKD